MPANDLILDSDSVLFSCTYSENMLQVLVINPES